MHSSDPNDDLIAVDVALLLPEAVNAVCRRYNRVLLEEEPDGFGFDATHLPHITLVQLFASRGNLVQLHKEIELVLRQRRALKLQASTVAPAGSTMHLRVASTPSLTQLHTDLATALDPLREAGGDGRAFYSTGTPVREGDIVWVSEFREAASFGNFDPHVTLGVGRTALPIQPLSFVADRVGLCQLGRFCTCRQVLGEWTLESGDR